MDLKLKAFPGAVHLFGIVITLRQIFTPQFDIPEPMQAALDHIDDRPLSWITVMALASVQPLSR